MILHNYKTKSPWSKNSHKILWHFLLAQGRCCCNLDLLIFKHILRIDTLSIPYEHDDIIKWKHFPRYWPFVRGIHRSPVNSPHKGQQREALMFSLICVWINVWVNIREAGDLRRHHGHYDVIVNNGEAGDLRCYCAHYDVTVMNCSQIDATRPLWWLVNIVSANVWMPPGTKPLPEPMLTKFCDALWWQWSTKSWLKLSNFIN